MRTRSIEEIKAKREELKKDNEKFREFIRDVFNGTILVEQMEEHLWRINRQIEILDWVLDDELPF